MCKIVNSEFVSRSINPFYFDRGQMGSNYKTGARTDYFLKLKNTGSIFSAFQLNEQKQLPPYFAIILKFVVVLMLAVISTKIFISASAFADEITDYQFALNAYDSGDYDTAISRFEKLLTREPPITNTALLVEIHKYLGASYMFKKDKEKARMHFTLLLKLEPNYELDPVLFPVEVLDEFLLVKNEMKEEIKRLEEEKKAKLVELEKKRKELREKWLKVVEWMNNPVYVKETIRKNNLFLAFIPFGVGQFQNEQIVKGWLFFSFETLLLLSTVTTYILTDYYFGRVSNKYDGPYLSMGEKLQHVTTVTFWTFVAVTLGGIIDALVFFRWKKKTYEKIREKDIPEQFRNQKPELPEIDIDEILQEKNVP